LGAGSVWISGKKFINPTIWQLEFPKQIEEHVVLFSISNGDIITSDLEMTGLLAEYLVLEHLKPLQFARWQPGATTHQMFVGQTN
jgi:hypothetical protein